MATGVQCHHCGVMFHEPDQYQEIWRMDGGDVIYVCRDELRCVTRATFNPPEQGSSTPLRGDPPDR
jgi:hypothetical protein